MENKTSIISGKNANNNYQEFTGTDHYYKHLSGYQYTDGVAQIAEDYGAYWFIDLILSYQGNKKIRGEGFQVWKLERKEDSKFRATCDDGNGNIFIIQNIEYSDFRDDELTFWLVSGIILLPSEY